MLIGRLLSPAGNRLTASLRKETVGASNQFQLKSREWSVVGESNGKSDSGVAQAGSLAVGTYLQRDSALGTYYV